MNCIVCFNNYDHLKHKPYSLSHCSHTFCIRCIEKFRPRKCPTCRKYFRAIHKNLALLDLLPYKLEDKKQIQELKQKLENIYEESVYLKRKLSSKIDKKIKLFSIRIEMIKNEVVKQANEKINSVVDKRNNLIDMVHLSKAKFINHIESNYKPDDKTIKLFESIKDSMSSYNINDLNTKIEDLNRYNETLKQIIADLSKFNQKIEFISEKTDSTNIGFLINHDLQVIIIRKSILLINF